MSTQTTPILETTLTSVEDLHLQLVQKQTELKTAAQAFENNPTAETREALKTLMQETKALQQQKEFASTAEYNGQPLNVFEAITLTNLGNAVETVEIQNGHIKKLKIKNTATAEQLKTLQLGLQLFTGMEELDVSNTAITALDLEGTRIKKVNCWNCTSLATLTNLPATLEKLDVSASELIAIPNEMKKLKQFQKEHPNVIINGLPK